jgi:hypothetical protein
MQLLLILRFVIAVLTPVSEADAVGLHRFAPDEVSVDHAYQHVWAARAATALFAVDAQPATHANVLATVSAYLAWLFVVDGDLTLAIGFHESHFTDNVVSHEPGKRVSCGAMTPYPTRTCVQKTLLEQYFDGVHHLAIDWKHAGDVRSDREALLGYAGGYYLIRACRQGPVLRFKTYGDDLCLTPEVFAGIRDRIRRARQPRTAA